MKPIQKAFKQSQSIRLKTTPQFYKKENQIPRSNTQEKMETTGISNLSQNSFIEDSRRLWNLMPTQVKQARSIYMAKKEIKTFCKSLPI